MKKNFDIPFSFDANSRRLKGIFIENYQSIKDPIYVEFEGITMLYGPNSAGKSAVIDALELWKYFVGVNDSPYNNSALWREGAGPKTRLGLAFLSKKIDDEGDRDVDRWRNENVYFSRPHIEFMDLINNKLVQIEYKPIEDGIKVAIDGVSLFEIYGVRCFEYNRDGSPSITEDEKISAEEDDREFWGEVVFNRSHPIYLNSFDRVRRLVNKIESDVDFEMYIERLPVSSKYTQSSASKFLIKSKDNFISIRGIGLDMYSGLHSRISLEVGMGVLHYLSQCDDGSKIDQHIRRELYEEIEAIANELNLIIAGLSFQLREILSYSHVRADRATLKSTIPAYVSDDLKFLNLGKQDGLHDSIKEYAQYLSSPSKFLTLGTERGRDFVDYCICHLLPSLRGYRIKADVLKVRNSTQDRLKRLRDIDEGKIVHLVVKTPRGDYLGLNDVGSGVSYILPILTSVWAASTTIIEQPELHLHPAAQCELADVFITAVSNGRKCLIESHSEHLLLRILRRIRETELKKSKSEELMLEPGKLNIYYFEPDGEGTTNVRRIRVDHLGEFLNDWPGGFFSEREEELFGE